jgi:hypothetical protein
MQAIPSPQSAFDVHVFAEASPDADGAAPAPGFAFPAASEIGVFGEDVVVPAGPGAGATGSGAGGASGSVGG